MHRGPNVVREDARAGEVVRAGGEVRWNGSVDDGEGDGFGGGGALGDEEELVVPVGGDGLLVLIVEVVKMIRGVLTIPKLVEGPGGGGRLRARCTA